MQTGQIHEIEDTLGGAEVKRTVWRMGGAVLLVLLLASGAFMAGRLLSARSDAAARDGGPMLQVSTADGQVVEAQWVKAEEVPDRPPDIAGVFVRRLDNSFFVDETEGGLVLARGDDDSFRVANATGKISEIVVVAETLVYVDVTLDNIEAALSDGKVYQRLDPGSVEEIGAMSFVRAWGEMRGDRLAADMLIYSRPPVVSR